MNWLNRLKLTAGIEPEATEDCPFSGPEDEQWKQRLATDSNHAGHEIYSPGGQLFYPEELELFRKFPNWCEVSDLWGSCTARITDRDCRKCVIDEPRAHVTVLANY